MDILIYAKWATDFTNHESEAPSIISIMIGIFLNFGEIEEGTVPLIFG